ncbi:1,5-anhydro-D-fructose reductase (1,5-anhydro-D-mannitol-forming) [Roseibium hamelinense]|uniref:1,5-anhydro-D-fructose reductase (1,5-anhydro-D-mannitol-forming) n=1 Tax=Roseibium hamelinense TaxID=150831 RepID=A0A562SZB0_9HYPH|nr:Gfo/Idh/MocA family oxidoreductase [Roseibium hamelinense]MTI44818.1 Gfo/Idh/MocA family oxidoreductase [Roseibium hamelinense]TWI85990.1 1,5-anhydro-D-fructose reductase (1,5-anhydro-D-mannitol-forming) [Roseibium hamelinense]
MKWGLIGASTIASEWMIGAFRAAGGDVVSVLSSDPSRAAEYSKAHSIARGTASLDELLSDPEIEAVYISTTNEKHFPQAIAAIKAGKHVLCEKPLAMTSKDAAEMVRAAKNAGLVFATNHHLRNAGSHLAIKDAVTSGRIGKVLSIRVFHAVYLPPHLQGWRIDNPAAGGGVIPDIVVHDADTVRFHLNEDPTDVVAMSAESGLGTGVEDSCMSIWQMPSGVMVQTHESFTHKYTESGLEIHGTEGSVVARNVMTQRPVGEIVLVTESGRESVGFADHNLYERAVALFSEAVAGQGRPSADGADGVKSLAVAEAVARSARTGQRTKVVYEEI